MNCALSPDAGSPPSAPAGRQCRAPSTSSQASSSEDEDEQHLSGAERRSASSGASSATHQYLFPSSQWRRLAQQQHPAAGGKRLSQYIKSIPVPLVASSLVSLLLLCLLLSECKSLQPAAQPEPPRRFGALSELEPQAAVPAAGNLLHLKRELVGDLLAARALARHSAPEEPYAQSKRQLDAEQRQAQPSLEALGSLLFASNQDANQEQLSQEESRFLDGEPSGRPDEEPLPASLRSSAIELDLSERRQQQHQQQLQQPPRQQQHQQRQHKLHEKPNHHQQEPPPTQQQYHQQQQQHTQRGNHDRAFDIPQIQCNNTVEGFERFACPTPDELDRYRCIEDRLFCDGYYDCPGGEDEERVACMYYKLAGLQGAAVVHHQEREDEQGLY